MQPGVIAKVTPWKNFAQIPAKTIVPVSAVSFPVPLPLTAQPRPALPLNLNPVELTVPFNGPNAMA